MHALPEAKIVKCVALHGGVARGKRGAVARRHGHPAAPHAVDLRGTDGVARARPVARRGKQDTVKPAVQRPRDWQ